MARVDRLRSGLVTIIQKLEQFQHGAGANEDGVLPQNLSEMTKTGGGNPGSTAFGDYHLGSLKDEIEMLPTRMIQLKKLAKLFPKQKARS